jgi:exodeoxyribonuclease V
VSAGAYELSPDQDEALTTIRTWLRETESDGVLTLGGFAGTGKTFLMSVLAKEIDGLIAFCAFTGKASSILGRKLAEAGIKTTGRTSLKAEAAFEPRPYCGTIHGLVMRPCETCMVEPPERPHTLTKETGCKEADFLPEAPRRPKRGDESPPSKDVLSDVLSFSPSKCPACFPVPPKPRTGACTACNDARYMRRSKLDRPYALLIVDEASMVSDDLLETLRSFHVPILAVGDHGQLPPVRGQGSLMRAPDIRLEKIHRQAAGNPIIALSERVRKTGSIDDALEDGKAFTILSQRNLDALLQRTYTPAMLGTDAILQTGIIASTNKGRCAINETVRETLGLSGEPPRQGEVLVCLRNAPPAYNGMRCLLMEDARQITSIKLAASLSFVEDGFTLPGVAMCGLQFFEEKTLDYEALQGQGLSFSRAGGLYDFGYALTCHKAQGSQFDDAIVVMENLQWMSRDDRTRWIYTAITRAAKRLIVVR